jgi:hypothetical protein
MATPRIFIGYEDKQAIAFEVLRYSLARHSSSPLDIRPLHLATLEREIGFRRPHDPLQSTEFTYSRFLVPHLCGFEGPALYLDCDMVCLGDVMELFALDLERPWLRVVKHEHHPTSTRKMDGKVQTSYPRKNWSSLMLLNCAALTCWTREAVESQPARWLHRFEPVPDACIGDLPPTWNVLDRYDQGTKLVHYTEGGPWLAEYRDHPYGDVWLACLEEYRQSREASLAGERGSCGVGR